MIEHQIINKIKQRFGTEYIGDDCAFLSQENLVITSDSMVEDIHFLSNIEPDSLGWKIVAVNISDVISMGAIPKYILLNLSINQEKAKSNWTDKFMDGVEKCCEEYNIQVIGGDLTKSDKIYLAATALGSPINKNQVCKRSNAKVGDTIWITGNPGSSAAGLYCLQNNIKYPQYQNLIKAHLEPKPALKQMQIFLNKIQDRVSMMDTSDGLLDTLSQISEQSDVLIQINIEDIPVDNNLKELADNIPTGLATQYSYLNWILAGGEDYQLVATASLDSKEKIEGWTCIGNVSPHCAPNGKKRVVFFHNKESFSINEFRVFDHFH